MTETETSKNNNKAKAKKPPVRRPITVLVPVDIDNLEAKDLEVPEAPPPVEGETQKPVAAVEMTAVYHVYTVPGGPGQKKAIEGILAKHNVDPRNLSRIKMFAGEKRFQARPQYNIRF